jgi:hypothetical protein
MFEVFYLNTIPIENMRTRAPRATLQTTILIVLVSRLMQIPQRNRQQFFERGIWLGELHTRNQLPFSQTAKINPPH